MFAICALATAGFAQQEEQGKKAVGYPAPPQQNLKVPPARQKSTDDKAAPAVYLSLQLNKLKDAYAQGDLSNLVATEQRVQDLLRQQVQALEAKIAADKTAATPERLARLEKMKSVLQKFDGHSFDLAKPSEAARDFAQLDAFAAALQAETESN